MQDHALLTEGFDTMQQRTEDRVSFQFTDLSIEELDEVVVLLHQHGARVEEETHRDVGPLLHTVHVFVTQHGDAIKTGAGLATALIGWLREWRKRKAAEKAVAEAARRPEIEIVRGGEAPLRLRDASDDEVRRFFERGGRTS